MATTPLARKLGIKPRMRALVVGAPPIYLKRLAPLPEGVVISLTANATHPFVQLFTTSLADIGKSVPYLLQHAARRALFWIAYPKDIRDRERPQSGSHFRGNERDRMASRFQRCNR